MKITPMATSMQYHLLRILMDAYVSSDYIQYVISGCHSIAYVLAYLIGPTLYSYI